VRPALRFESLLETMFALAADGAGFRSTYAAENGCAAAVAA
jgi:hypothetical protein